MIDPPRKPAWPIMLGALLVTVVGLGLLIYLPGRTATGPTARPAASQAISLSPSAPSGNVLPFDKLGGGEFEVLRHNWTAAGLEVDYRISVNQGTHELTMYAFLNSTREGYYEDRATIIRPREGNPATGRIFIEMPRGDTTLVLSTESGTPITALPIPG